MSVWICIAEMGLFKRKKNKTKILSFIRVLGFSLVHWEGFSLFLGIRTVFKFKCP